MTVAGYCRNAACCQLAMSVRIQVSPMTVVSLMQIKISDTWQVFAAASPAPWGQKQNTFCPFFMHGVQIFHRSKIILS